MRGVRAGVGNRHQRGTCMKQRDSKEAGAAKLSQAPLKKHRAWRRLGIVVLVIVLILAVGRAVLPWGLRKYVNRTLDRSPLYNGKIGPIQVHLWKGSYSIQDIRLNKTTGNVPVP